MEEFKGIDNLGGGKQRHTIDPTAASRDTNNLETVTIPPWSNTFANNGIHVYFVKILMMFMDRFAYRWVKNGHKGSKSSWKITSMDDYCIGCI